MRKVLLKSSDDVDFLVDESVAKAFNVVLQIIINPETGEKETNFENPVSIPNVSSMALGKLIKWVSYKQKNHANASHQGAVKRSPNWDEEFKQLDGRTLTEIMEAAESFEIKDLVDFTVSFISKTEDNKTPQETDENSEIQVD